MYRLPPADMVDKMREAFLAGHRADGLDSNPYHDFETGVSFALGSRLRGRHRVEPEEKDAYLTQAALAGVTIDLAKTWLRRSA